jgi:hypothetical protein
MESAYMARCTRELNSAPPAVAALISQIRDIEKRMYENGADRVRLAAAEGRMIAKLRDLLPHGKWLRTLKQACRLGRTQANTYMTLGDHPQLVEQYCHSCGNSGRAPSIIGALHYISPPPERPTRPKQLADIEQPRVLGAYLENDQELFWAALQYAVTLKCDIEHRAQKLATAAIEKAAAEAQATLALLTNASQPNLEAVREGIARVACLLDPTLKPAPAPPRPLQLDRSIFLKAMGLDQPDLDIPEHAAPSTTTIN